MASDFTIVMSVTVAVVFIVLALVMINKSNSVNNLNAFTTLTEEQLKNPKNHASIVNTVKAQQRSFSECKTKLNRSKAQLKKLEADITEKTNEIDNLNKKGWKLQGDYDYLKSRDNKLYNEYRKLKNNISSPWVTQDFSISPKLRQDFSGRQFRELRDPTPLW